MFRSPDFKIVKRRKFMYILSAVIIVAGVANILLHGGLNMGIDFAGGNVLRVEIRTENVDIADVRAVLVGTGYGNDVQGVDAGCPEGSSCPAPDIPRRVRNRLLHLAP